MSRKLTKAGFRCLKEAEDIIVVCNIAKLDDAMMMLHSIASRKGRLLPYPDFAKADSTAR